MFSLCIVIQLPSNAGYLIGLQEFIDIVLIGVMSKFPPAMGGFVCNQGLGFFFLPAAVKDSVLSFVRG